MAHGNISDLVFLCAIGIVVQLWGFPHTLYQENGPVKPQFEGTISEADRADLAAMFKLIGGLILTLGMTFSGVKWNPINGKMAFLGGSIALGYLIYTSSEALKMRPLGAYVAVLVVGLLHIGVLPSNHLPPKTEKTKNNHGNSSDLVALFLIVQALGCLIDPTHLCKDLGPFKGFKTQSDDMILMIKFAGCLLLILALMLSGVKWNPINGKMAGLGGFIASAYIAYSTFKADADQFVPRIFYVYAVTIFLGAVHTFALYSNPLPEKTDKKA